MKQAMQWAHAMQRVDELPAATAGLVGFVSFLFAGLAILQLPTWGFVLGVLGLLSLLVWLAVSGQPVVKLVWPQLSSPSSAPQALPATPPKPGPTDEPLPMVELPGGEFWMGSPESESGRFDDEVRHRVKVSAFAIGKYPVTQKQYAEVMGINPSENPGDEFPVEHVSWFDAVRFCNKLSERAGLQPCYRIVEPKQKGGQAADGEASQTESEVEWDREANGYRLPTEAEWEYACRAGTKTTYSFGDDPAKLGDYAWFERNSDGKSHEVGTKKPNGWGLFDVHGNVWEWCWDCYGGYSVTSDNDKTVTLTDPIGPPMGGWRFLRGGSFGREPRNLRSAVRNRRWPGERIRTVGFRCVRGSGRQR